MLIDITGIQKYLTLTIVEHYEPHTYVRHTFTYFTNVYTNVYNSTRTSTLAVYPVHICTILTSTNLDNIYLIIHICDPNVYNYSTNVCI